MRPTFLLVLNLVLMLGLSGCERESGVEKNAPLVDAAYETYSDHVRAVNSGKEILSNEIHERYWAEAIKDLKPIKVYKHRVNIVVVQKVSDNVEEGKYIYIPVSSYLPMDSVDNFAFQPNPKKGNQYKLGDGIFDYKRTIEN